MEKVEINTCNWAELPAEARKKAITIRKFFMGLDHYKSDMECIEDIKGYLFTNEGEIHNEHGLKLSGGVGEWNFLGFTIKNTGNSDGYVMFCSKDMKTMNDLYRVHMGNYNELNSAKKAALVQYLMDRPNIFAGLIRNFCLYGKGGYGGFHLLRESLKKEGIDMPKEITKPDSLNSSIIFNGKSIF